MVHNNSHLCKNQVNPSSSLWKVQQSVPLQTNGPNELTWISSASTESEGTETDPMTKLFTSRGAEGRVEGVAPPGVEPGGRAVGGSLWTTCMTFP